MKLALFSDLHANLPALEACLEHARQQGDTRLALLGDLVGCQPHPSEMVERCRTLQQEGAIVLRGNHDTFDINPAPAASAATWGNMSSIWTQQQLDAK